MAEEWRLGHRPGLDGVRGVAVVLVLALHWWPTAAPGGYLGVDLFFVLSGFLITRLLLEEHGRTGRVRLVRFYERRARRLFPALIILLGVCVTVPGVWMVALYGANWARIGGHLEGGPLEHTWSLAIEEQFYLLWPAVFIVLRRTRLAPAFLAGAIVLVMLHRVSLTNSTWAVNGFDARADGLLVGCLAAFLAPHLARWRHWRIVGAGSVGMLAWWALSGFVAHRYGYTLVALACVPLIFAGAASTRGPLTTRPLVELGKLSYSLYLWHYPVTWWLRDGDLHHTTAGSTALAIVLSAAAAVASSRLVEQRFRRSDDGAHAKPSKGYGRVVDNSWAVEGGEVFSVSSDLDGRV